MTDLFIHAEQARQLKGAVLDRVADHNQPWVKRAKEIALHLAASNGEVNVEDVLKIFPRPNYINVNAIGSIMRDKRLKLTGYTIATKESSHGRRIGVYSLKN
jgi:hypothetical protein